MKILVTGSEGNIGSELVPYLESKGHEVLCLDIVQKYRKNYILCDILNLADAEGEIQDFWPEAVYHMAAMVSRVTCEKSVVMAVNTNITGTVNIMRLCSRMGAKLINFSTSEVYGNQSCLLDEWVKPEPNNVYGITKLWAESLVKYHSDNTGMKYINLRPFMMYSENELMGENRSAMIRFAENIWKGNQITVHRGAIRSWLHISDAVILLEKMLYVETNETLNMGNNDFMDIEDMAKIMCSIAERYVVEKPSNAVCYPLIKIEELPGKMTLKKIAGFRKQQELLQYTPKVSNRDGIFRVMQTVKKRLEY